MDLLNLIKPNQNPSIIPLQKQNTLSQHVNQNQQRPPPAKQQKLSDQSIAFANLFKNNEMLKDQLLVSHLYHALVGQQKHVTETKIVPTLLVNKIQQCRPHYKNSVIYKELAFDILLETQSTYKVKNCVSPARPNSQVYKRLSKNFFQNIKNGIDQCILFTGLQAGARVESSIGNQANPGLFMIIAIAVLDEKYKENHERFDAEFSFIEYRGQKMYDLINYTEVPLEAKFRQNSSNSQNLSNIEFCEHRVKVCTFLQFIKLFKIALFNNKERDIKTNKDAPGKYKGIEKAPQFASSFIMKIRIKKYNLDSELIYEQETVLIDLDENSSLRNNNQKSEKSFEEEMKELHQSGKKGSDSSSRSLMDYILIEINNSNPLNKHIHYHMVEKNLLLQVIKKYLRQKDLKLPQTTQKGQQKTITSSYATKQVPKQYFAGGTLFIVNSLTPNPYNYDQNIRLFQRVTQALGNEWQAYGKSKNVYNKCFDMSFADKILQKVLYILRNKKYESLKSLYMTKEFFVKQSKKIISDIKLNKNIISEYLEQKKNLTYNQNIFTAYEFQLIGNCIKSDNFKDFYTSKSYLALPRQIQIKTEQIKASIISGLQGLKQIQNKYYAMKKKQKEDKKLLVSTCSTIKNTNDAKQSFNGRKTINLAKLDANRSTTKTKTKFRLLDSQNFDDNQDLDSFNSLRKYIYDYFSQIWYKVELTDERTVTDELIFQEFFISQVNHLKDRFSKFVEQVQDIQDVNIKSLDGEKIPDLDNLTQLMRSINQAKKSILKHDPKHTGRSPFGVINANRTQKKTSDHKTSNCLPKIQQFMPNKKEKSLSTKELKQIKRPEVFEIRAKVDFGSLILHPKRQS